MFSVGEKISWINAIIVKRLCRYDLEKIFTSNRNLDSEKPVTNVIPTYSLNFLVL